MCMWSAVPNRVHVYIYSVDGCIHVHVHVCAYTLLLALHQKQHIGLVVLREGGWEAMVPVSLGDKG